MAAYNRWQNDSLYACAATLSDQARRLDRGAFFASIHETLNHVLWGDQFWLHKLAEGPEPRASSVESSKNQHPLWTELKLARELTDDFLSDWATQMNPSALNGEVSWFSANLNAEVRRPKQSLVVQLFNHGTHHRGQVHAMLTAAGGTPEDTDVHFMPSTYFEWSE